MTLSYHVSIICQFSHYPLSSLTILVKLLDWGEDGLATAAETAALRTSFRQEVAVWHKLDHPNVTKVRVPYCFFLRLFMMLECHLKVILLYNDVPKLANMRITQVCYNIMI